MLQLKTFLAIRLGCMLRALALAGKSPLTHARSMFMCAAPRPRMYEGSDAGFGCDM